MTDSATMSDHEQACKDDEDDRVHTAAKEYLPECALEFVNSRDGMKKLLDEDDHWLADLHECFEVLDRARMIPQGPAGDLIFRILDRLRATAIDIAKDHEDVCIAAQGRVNRG